MQKNCVNQLINTWDERSNFTIKGITNLSRADLDTLLLYAESWDGHKFVGLMHPLGSIKDVLSKFNLIQNTL